MNWIYSFYFPSVSISNKSTSTISYILAYSYDLKKPVNLDIIPSVA